MFNENTIFSVNDDRKTLKNSGRLYFSFPTANFYSQNKKKIVK